MYEFFEARRMIFNNVQTDSQLDIITLLVNFSCDLGYRKIHFDFLELSEFDNVRTISNLTKLHFGSTFHVNWGQNWPDMIFLRPGEWFSAMFEPNLIWLNFIVGKLFLWIGEMDYQKWLHGDWSSDFEQRLNQIQCYIISQFVSFSICQVDNWTQEISFLKNIQISSHFE